MLGRQGHERALGQDALQLAAHAAPKGPARRLSVIDEQHSSERQVVAQPALAAG
mgnify:CR=1 FL=1